MKQADVLMGGLALAALGFVGYAAYTGAKALPWLNQGNAGDQYRANQALAYQGMDQATHASAEAGRSFEYWKQSEGMSGELKNWPGLAEALADYERETNEYLAMAKEYDPTSNEALEQYPKVMKEYRDHLAAFDQVMMVYQANNS